MSREYIGIIVEESLDDNRVINKLDLRKVHITGHQRSSDRWHMYEVNVSKEEIEELSKHIIGDWYMHFWKGTDIIAVFSRKTFKFSYEKKDTWRDVLEYGRSIGLPDNELDFPIKGL